MNFDIRIPIGLLFGMLGLILTGFGLFTMSDPVIYVRSLNINFNFIWGIVMFVFGACMLLLSYRRKKNK